MKVLHVFSFSGRSSGIVIVVSNISAEMAACGDSVAWLSSFPAGEAQRSLVSAGVSLLGTSARTSGFGSLLPGGAWTIPKWGVPERLPDVVHFHGIYLPPQARVARACRHLNIPYIVTPHGSFMPEAQKYMRLKKTIANKLLFFEYLRNASALHALGAEEAREILRVFPRSMTRIIPNGIKADEIDSVGHPGRSREGQGIEFLFIGRLDVQHKGLDILVEAVRLAAPEFRRSRSHVHLVGPFDTPRDESSLTKAIARSSLEDIIRIEGPRYDDEKENLLLRSDVFIHTSRYEGLPMAVLEAMAFGKPCLVTPGTNLALSVDEYGAGWTSDPSPCRIAASLRGIIGSSSESLRSKGERARTLVKDRYLLSTTVDQLRQLYRDVIAVK